MTLHEAAKLSQETANLSQYFAKLMDTKKERFVRLCNKWTSARALADDLATLGYPVGGRTCTSWRSRSFEKLPYGAVQAVKLAAERKKLEQSKAWSRSLQEAAEL